MLGLWIGITKYMNKPLWCLTAEEEGWKLDGSIQEENVDALQSISLYTEIGRIGSTLSGENHHTLSVDETADMMMMAANLLCTNCWQSISLQTQRTRQDWGAALDGDNCKDAFYWDQLGE